MIDLELVYRVTDRLRARRTLGWAITMCEESNVSFEEVVGVSSTKCRTLSPNVLDVRHRLWIGLKDRFKLSYPQTAAIFEVHHTSVMYAYGKMAG